MQSNNIAATSKDKHGSGASKKKPPPRKRGANGSHLDVREMQLQAVLEVLKAVKAGSFSARVGIGEVPGTIRSDRRRGERRRPAAADRRLEITRVAREVGTEGKLGAQAEVQGVSGTWKDLTDNVNVLAGNLTNQVRNIAVVTTAVANGDLSKQITVEAKGRSSS